jgi:hypothetical protein
MTASYAPRLLLQCLASAFLVHVLIGLAVCAVTPAVIRFAERLRPAAGARLLFALRLLPLVAAMYVAFALVVPSYLRLEPEIESEHVGLWGACLAVAAVAVWIPPTLRVMRAVRESSRFARALERHNFPCVAVSGLLKPQLLVSQAARDLFAPEELDIVLRHETAHGRSRDNLKRLFWLMLPDAVPFVCLFSRLERSYHRLIEWAADDFAAAGRPQDATSLAHALIAFARARGRAPSCALATGLVDNNADLAQRVQRLLAGPDQPAPARGLLPGLLAVSIAVVCLTAGVFTNLGHVHRALELLSR